MRYTSKQIADLMQLYSDLRKQSADVINQSPHRMSDAKHCLYLLAKYKEKVPEDIRNYLNFDENGLEKELSSCL